MHAVLTLLAALALAGADAKKDEDAKALHGDWKATDGEASGQKLPDELLRSIALSLADGKYKVDAPQVKDNGTYTIDTGKDPKTMDIKSEVGPNKEKTIQAIYKLEKNKLTVCYDLTTNGRPSEFTTKDHEGWLLMVYEKK